MLLNFWLQTGKYQSFLRRYDKSILIKGFQSYKPAKLVVKKKLRHFGFEATFFMTLHGKSLLFERPGCDSRLAQTLRAYIFAAPWPKEPKIIFLKVLIYIYKNKKRKRGFEYF